MGVAVEGAKEETNNLQSSMEDTVRALEARVAEMERRKREFEDIGVNSA